MVQTASSSVSQEQRHTDPVREVRIRAQDGFTLAATLYGRPDAEDWVVINSATATPRRFYRRFASALADAGYGVVTYDYRGVGDSRPESLRGFHARVRDWALLDIPAVVGWARAGARRVLLVGHSVGGQLAGLLESPDSIDGMVTLSSQSGYYGLQGGEQRGVVWFHVHVTIPALSRMFGYMPWSAFGGQDLPQGAALEWARWCRDPEYLLGDDSLPLERYDEFRAPILAYSFEDDKWGTRRSVDAFMKAYPNVERRHRAPADLRMDRIGHFGAFRPTARCLWDEVLAWFEDLPRANG